MENNILFNFLENNSNLSNKKDNINIISIEFNVKDKTGISFSLPVSINKLERESNYKRQKEKLYLTAIKNLFKKNNFLKLTLELCENSISEDEFEEEIKSNESSYVISLAEIHNELQARAINDIVSALELKLDTDDVSELFSVSTDSLFALLKEK